MIHSIFPLAIFLASMTLTGKDSRSYAAQPGSAGGTLGKSNKSVSGGAAKVVRPVKPQRKGSPFPYDGTWKGWLRTYGGRFNVPVEATFTVVVSKGNLRGTVFMYGQTRTITAKVGSRGALIGGRLRGRTSYVLHGSIKYGLGEGDTFGWKLEYKMKRAR